MKKHGLRGLALALALLLSVSVLQLQPERAAAEEAEGLRISELMHKNKASLRDEDGDFPDWIELTNVSDETISLKGVRISDREGRWGWGLPDRSMEPGERLIVFDHGRVVMDGSPEEVFSRPEELIAIGLAVPQATSVAMALRSRGLALEGAVYTHEQLLAAILKAKEAAAC